jgi:hypothetical protein
MAVPRFADPANLVVVERDEPPAIPDDVPLSVIDDQAVRGKRQLSRDQMRLLIELLPYYLSKQPTRAHVSFDFAQALEQAVERAKLRSFGAQALLVGPVPELPASELKGPFVRGWSPISLTWRR